jgi:OOP family OmpA-OmpF porin
MKTKYFLPATIVLLVLSQVLPAQDNNLVLNGSFENSGSRKIHGRAEYFKVDSLSSSNNTSVDIYSTNTCNHDQKAPDNAWGNQGAKSGNNYAGIVAYYADDAGFLKSKPGYGKYSEYIQFTLKEPMVAGKVYTVSFNTALAEKSAYAVSGLGVYFSDEKLDIKNNAFLNITPHIITAEIVTGTDWTTFSGTYVATGGERYLTLGCFEKYMDTLKVAPAFTNNSRKAYYFIDDVSVAPQLITPEDMTMVLTGSCYQLKNLNFETDKAVIMPDSYTELNSLVSFLKTYPYLVVYVDGHTDKTGTDEHNDKLSMDRAQSVAAYLTAHGVDGSRLKSRGYGESMPLENTTASSEVNRRVEITICAAVAKN